MSAGKESVLFLLRALQGGIDGLPIPVLSGCLGGIIAIIERENLSGANIEAFDRLKDRVIELDQFLKDFHKMPIDEIPKFYIDDAKALTNKLQTIAEDFNSAKKKSSLRDRLKSLITAEEDAKLLDDMAVDVGQAIQDFQIECQTKHRIEDRERVRKRKGEALMSNLPTTIYASQYKNIESCEEGTRLSILQDVKAWATQPMLAQILWLNGIAGSGKSTLAKTVAQRFRNEGIFVANFIFSKANGIVSGQNLVTTLVAQLSRDESLKPFMTDSLPINASNFTPEELAEQFDTLLIEPLTNAALAAHPITVIIIDALDECDSDDWMIDIFQLFVDKIHKVPWLRLFLSSRPEHPINQVVQSHRKGRIHEMDLARISASDDIRLYLQRRLYKEYMSSGYAQAGVVSWPSPPDLDMLVTRAGNLFIYAATAVRFIGGEGDPNDHLRTFLGVVVIQTNPFSQLDAVYCAILQKVIPQNAFPDFHARYQMVTGAVLFCLKSISVNKLVELSLNRYDVQEVRSALQNLHSVISVPKDDNEPAVMIYHKSFLDFIEDPQRCSYRIACLETIEHRYLLMMRWIALCQGPTVLEKDRLVLHNKYRTKGMFYDQDVRNMLGTLQRYCEFPNTKTYRGRAMLAYILVNEMNDFNRDETSFLPAVDR